MPRALTEDEKVILGRFEAEGGLFHQMPEAAQQLWKDLYPGERYILAVSLTSDFSRIDDQKYLPPEERAKLKQERLADMPKSVNKFLSEHADDLKWETRFKAERKVEEGNGHNTSFPRRQ